MYNRLLLILLITINTLGYCQNKTGNGYVTIMPKTSDIVLQTGIYFITDSITDYKRCKDSINCFYINPEPILTIKNFKKISVYTKKPDYMMVNGIALNFDEAGTKAFDEATKKSVGKMLAIIIDNKLISSPEIMSEITKGNCIITFSNNITKTQLEDIRKHLESEK
jgi:preprotein translocase subunit SecD